MQSRSAFSRFFSLFNVFAAARDFYSVWREENPHRLRIMAVSAALTCSIFILMWGQEEVGPPPRPQIDWITTFEPGRTDEEIMASNIANQEKQDALRAERAEREAKVREVYEAIGRASGMDVEAAKAEGEAERAAQAAAEEAARQRALEEIEAGNSVARQSDR
ncbi:hypothetical protein [Croceicoccus naphthovorans]|uniref:hypothetical protein n=1 Tax=Croceicoccus naphthovorans TaxID=1348774 RepID=UPI0012E00081|nr:hypothetical protein [Croceicoccus naphthovorans]MBB3991711.1 hypothetical protein [Croceicoccus naphthovorans]